MSNYIRCGGLTRRSRPCRNPAMPDSDPPRCARHRQQPLAVAKQPYLPGLSPEELDAQGVGRVAPHAQSEQPEPPVTAASAPALATQPYLPGLSPDELDALELDGVAPDLQRELQEVRLTMYRLLKLWKDADQPVTPEEARRLAALIFSGARTVAHLLNQRAKATDDARDWLGQALDRLAAEQGLDV